MLSSITYPSKSDSQSLPVDDLLAPSPILSRKASDEEGGLICRSRNHHAVSRKRSYNFAKTANEGYTFEPINRQQDSDSDTDTDTDEEDTGRTGTPSQHESEDGSSRSKFTTDLS